MRVAWKVMNPGSEIPPEMYRVESVWRDPSTPTYAAKADAATKLYGGGVGVIPKERARIDIGYTIEEREQMKIWDQEENPMGQLAAMYGQKSPQTPAESKTPAEEPQAPPAEAA
jgi:hypothetical protein